MSLSNLVAATDHVRTFGTDSYGFHLAGCEHPYILGGHERAAVPTFGHYRCARASSLYSKGEMSEFSGDKRSIPHRTSVHPVIVGVPSGKGPQSLATTVLSTARPSEGAPYRLEMADVPEDSLVDLLTEIIARETVNPPGNESTLASYFVERFKASSVEFDIELQEVQPGRPNVIVRAGDPAKRSLLLTGHMDVVPASADDWLGDPFELRRENDRLIGRGTTDMKGALAAKLVAAETFLDDHDDTGEVILAFVVNEEVGGMGTEALVEGGIEADAAIIGEPTRLQVAIAEYGAVGYSLTVSGESGHSGRPDLAINAIDGLRRVLDQVKPLDDDVRIDEHDLFTPGPTISIPRSRRASHTTSCPTKRRRPSTGGLFPTPIEDRSLRRATRRGYRGR